MVMIYGLAWNRRFICVKLLRCLQASSLFLEGVDFERRGEMCDAVQRYMAAVRLVPDIELKLFKNRHSASSSNAVRTSLSFDDLLLRFYYYASLLPHAR